MISRTFVIKDSKTMLKLYQSLVRPKLEYCVQAWRPYLRKDIDLLEKVQKRVMVQFSVPNSYTNYKPNKLPLLLATWCKTEYYTNHQY